MSPRYRTPLEELVEPGVRVRHIEPLQKRIPKNRRKLVGFLVAYTTAMAVSAAMTVGFAAVLLSALVIFRFDPDAFTSMSGVGEFIWRVTLGSFLISLTAAWLWAGLRLLRSDLALMERLGGRLPEAGTWLPARRVLHDVALAAGMKQVPGLYVIDADQVNAFILGRPNSRVRIGVTRGMLERIEPDEQRAVFANLVARVLSGDTLWATAVSALVGPLAAYREASLRWDMPDFGEPTPKPVKTQSSDPEGSEIVGAFFMIWAVVVILTEVLSWYSREAVWRMAEKADAEGMLLLRDPGAMLRAIEHMLDRNNHVPSAGEAYSPLFYCWAGFGFAPEDDPERRRVVRLREALGAEGAAYVPRPNVPDWSNPPVAPRVEALREVQRQAANGGRSAR